MQMIISIGIEIIIIYFYTSCFVLIIYDNNEQFNKS